MNSDIVCCVSDIRPMGNLIRYGNCFLEELCDDSSNQVRHCTILRRQKFFEKTAVTVRNILCDVAYSSLVPSVL